MSNRRIQKKRDRHRLIIGVLRHAHVYEHEPLPKLREMKRLMDRMTMPTLLRLCDAILFEQIRRYSPFRPMVPRKINAGEFVNWRPVISDVKERERE